jgi:hypothetical protein
MQDEPRSCLREGNQGHTCAGPVTGRPSFAGTGTIIYECSKAQDESAAFNAEVRERFPDTDIAPDWFDADYAGERWNEDE